MIVVPVPRQNVNDDVVIVNRFIVENEAQVESGQPIVEIETSKTVIEVEAPGAGIVHFHVAEGDEVPIGASLCHIASDDADESQEPVELLKGDRIDTPTESVRLISKAARATAAELGIDVSDLPGGWISSHAVRAMVDDRSPVKAPTEVERTVGVKSQPPVIEDSGLPDYDVERLSLRKRSEIGSLSALGAGVRQSTIGISTPRLGSRLREPIPLFADGILDLIVYEASKLMAEFPFLNGFYSGNDEVALYKQVHAGVSFDNDRNLKVLRVEEADQLTLSDVQLAINALLVKYEGDEDLSEELQGATYTVTDLSHMGADFVFPLLNGYQALIIGVVKRSARQYRLIASFDHRVAEGLYVSQFLDKLSRNVASHFRDAAVETEDLSCYFCERPMTEERAMGNKGLINITTGDGQRVLVCRNCFEGF